MTSPSDDASFLWHHTLHEQIAGETLFFVLIRATPYRQQRVLTSIVETCAEFDVRSYAVWEVFGDYDVLLRLWLPRERAWTRFQRDLSRRVGNTDFFNAARFQVDSFECHSELDSELVAESASRLLDPRDLNVPTNSVPSVRAKRYREGGLASPTSRGTPKKAQSLKLFTWVRVPDDLRSVESDQEAVSRIRKVLTSQPAIAAASLFTGTGRMGAFLISSRLALSKFEEFGESIAPAVQEATGHFTSKTVSFVASRSQPLMRCEMLRTTSHSERDFSDAPPSPSDVRRLLHEGEADAVEVKGSAFKDLGRLLNTGKRGQKDPAIVHGIVKNVCGFLNAGGGTLIIGALEAKHFPLDFVRKRLPEAFEVGEFTVVGVDAEMQGGQNWDSYELQLRNTISSQITIAPEPHIRISRIVLSGKALACIEVSSSDRAFWVKSSAGDREEYYVRRGNRTVELTGRALEIELERRRRP